MATAVEQMMPSGYLVITDPSVSDQNLPPKLKTQNHYLSFFVIKNMLKADNLNGIHCRLSTSLFTHEVIVESGVKDAEVTIENACTRLKPIAQEEMETLLHTLDISDANLCNNYQRVARLLMTENIGFGRIVMLFFFTYVLCKRLHKECRPRQIESVVDWLAEFLSDTVSPWLVNHHHGQWSNIQGSVNIDLLSSRKRPTSATAASSRGGMDQDVGVGTSGWLTMAAVGVGAFVVGALAIR